MISTESGALLRALQHLVLRPGQRPVRLSARRCGQARWAQGLLGVKRWGLLRLELALRQAL